MKEEKDYEIEQPFDLSINDVLLIIQGLEILEDQTIDILTEREAKKLKDSLNCQIQNYL